MKALTSTFGEAHLGWARQEIWKIDGRLVFISVRLHVSGTPLSTATANILDENFRETDLVVNDLELGWVESARVEPDKGTKGACADLANRVQALLVAAREA